MSATVRWCSLKNVGVIYLVFEVDWSVEIRDFDVVRFAEHFALDSVLEYSEFY